MIGGVHSFCDSESKVTLAEDDQPFQSDDDDDDDDNDDGDWLPSESTLANLHAEASSALSKPPVVAGKFFFFSPHHFNESTVMIRFCFR